jgi:pimeloyl-ACP methyl ester carboxylesterase
MQQQSFMHEGHSLNVVTAGSPKAPPILMIHGYCSSHQVWRTTIPALEKNRYCVAVDVLGHGLSSIDPSGDYSIPAQGRRVLALADHLGFERFSLVGHSMGGQIALCIASMLAPQRVEKIVDVSGVVGAKLTPLVERTIFAPLRMFYGTPLAYPLEVYQRLCSPRFKWAARYQFGSWFHDMDSLDFDWWRVDRELANRPGMRHTWYHGMKAIEGLDLTANLSSITAPTLVLFGAQDNVVPIQDAHLAHEHIPGSQLCILDRCGHFPMFEQQQRYMTAVSEFLGA